MTFVKGLLLGTAATFVATAGAQAADLPVKAKAVEYVKVCSLYGAGFYYIPGTDTCIKLGGYLRAEVGFNTSGASETPAWAGAAGQQNRYRNYYQFRSRQDLNIDTRTATEYGVVRTFFDATYTWTSGQNSSTGYTGDAVAGGSLGVYFAFIQFAGFTIGKAASNFSAPWNGSPGNIGSNLLGGDDTSTGVNQFAYTAEFGNGVSGTISVEDQSAYRYAQLYNVNTSTNPLVFSGTASTYFLGTGSGQSSYGGTTVPDVVGKLRVDQAWGLFQVTAAAHNIHAAYYGATEVTGHPEDKYGFAVGAALSLKNLPTGPGDSINIDATYADGATRYVIGGTSPNAFAMYGGTDVAGAYQSVAFASAPDGIFGAGGQIQTVKAFGIRGAFNHNWNPNWTTSLFGAYSAVDFGGAGKALYNAGLNASVAGLGTTYFGDPNFKIAQIGTRTAWTPVKGLTFSAEVQYTLLDQNYSGVTAGAVSPSATKPTASYQFKDQDTWTGLLRAQRTF
jgi:hypothetical protein